MVKSEGQKSSINFILQEYLGSRNSNIFERIPAHIPIERSLPEVCIIYTGNTKFLSDIVLFNRCIFANKLCM